MAKIFHIKSQSDFVRGFVMLKELLGYAEEVAKAEGCSTLRLCAVIENERAIKFYDRLGWTKRSYAFTKKLTP